VNASLNALAALLLVTGRVWIHQGRRQAHKRAMLSAFGVSCLFLVLYVVEKVSRGFESMHYHGEGAVHTLYLCILASHSLLAMTVPVLAVVLIRLAWTDRFARHRALARVAWPIWLYVSVTGVVIYLMLYPFNPPVSPVGA